MTIVARIYFAYVSHGICIRHHMLSANRKSRYRSDATFEAEKD